MSVDSQMNAKAFAAAITERDAASLAEQLQRAEFVLIHIQEQLDESNPEEELGALTADVDNEPCLVAFASQDHAAAFVQSQTDVFDQNDEVGGFVVSGHVMLDYLGDEYGLLINPESDQMCWVDRDLIADVLDEMGLE